MLVLKATERGFSALVGPGTARELWETNGVQPSQAILMEGMPGGGHRMFDGSGRQAQSLPDLDNLDPAY